MGSSLASGAITAVAIGRHYLLNYLGSKLGQLLEKGMDELGETTADGYALIQGIGAADVNHNNVLDFLQAAAGGNDSIDAGPGDDLVLAGDGNDTIDGGSGNDVLVGGDGNDLIWGRIGRDLVIGGRGADRLYGHQDEDLMIGGWTAFDTDRLALKAIMSEWTSQRSYSDRVKNLSGNSQSATFVARTNGNVFLLGEVSPAKTVYDEGEVDVLSGNQAADWFFANLTGGVLDILDDRTMAETQNDIN